MYGAAPPSSVSFKARVLQDVIFSVQHRQLAADKQDAAVIIQRPDFIRRHQLARSADGSRCWNRCAPWIHCASGYPAFPSQQFEIYLKVLTSLPPKVQQRIRVADQTLPVILEQGFQRRNVLQDDGGHDVAAAHGSLQLAEIIWEGDITKLVHHHSHGNGSAPWCTFVGLIVKALKGAGVEHTHNVIKGAVIIRMMANTACLRSPIFSSSMSSLAVIFWISGRIKADSRTAAEIRMLLAVLPAACL